MPKEVKENLRVGEISEILLLSVLDRLGAAGIPQIYKSLQLATEKGKAPFSIGPSIGQVLEWRERLNEVQEEERGHERVFSITDVGKKTVEAHEVVIRRVFPNLSKVRRNALTAEAQ